MKTWHREKRVRHPEGERKSRREKRGPGYYDNSLHMALSEGGPRGKGGISMDIHSVNKNAPYTEFKRKKHTSGHLYIIYQEEDQQWGVCVPLCS